MKCIACKAEIKKLKKNELYHCECGAKLLAIQMKKELVVMDLSMKKGEK